MGVQVTRAYIKKYELQEHRLGKNSLNGNQRETEGV